MTTINDLPGVTTIDNSDLIPLYQKRNRRTRNIAIEELRDYIYVSVDGKYAPIEHVGSRGADQHAPVLAGGDAGFMSGSDKSKLDGIEEGAQVNVPANLSTTVGASTVTVNSDTGTDATIPAATTTDAGVMTAADKTKLDGIAAGAQVNVPTNLSTTTSATTLTVNSDTGTDATLPAATTSVAGVMTAADKTKLDGVASGAVALSQVVAYAGTAKTLALTDNNTIIDCTSSSAVTITIPPQSSVAWTADAEIHVRMSGIGVVSITVGAGVTIPPLTAPVALAGQGAVVTLKRRSSDVWAVVGLSNVESVVRGTVLTGLSTSDSTPVVATDTVLIGFGKLQAQMGAVADALDTINGVVI